MTKLIAQTKFPIQGFNDGITAPSDNPAARTAEIISNILTIITIFAGLAFLFYFVIGAVTYITSAGDPQKLEKAKSQIGQALTGLLVVVLVFPIAYILSALLGIDILNFDILVPNLSPTP